MKPKAQVRRFDVFAEYSKLEALREGRPLDEAKGHGVWLAKVVASCRGRPSLAPSSPGHGGEDRDDDRARPAHEKFKSLGGEVQTDVLFDREIVARMGEDFYKDVFAPAVAKRFEEGASYQGIRDAIRREWKP